MKKTLEYSITIDAPRQTVRDAMLQQDSYREWTTPFMEGMPFTEPSYYEGSWEKGEQIRFLAPNGEGMVAEIAENRPDFISIRHFGTMKNGQIDTDSPETKSWAPAYENYEFRELGPDATEVRIAMESNGDHDEFMNTAWPKALAKLKEISEAKR